jgi:two-component system sensor histidine kinase ChvG
MHAGQERDPAVGRAAPPPGAAGDGPAEPLDTAPARGETGSGFSAGRLLNSLITKLAVLLLVFTVVPVILYDVFQEADAEKQRLLLQSVREQGRLVGESLRPLLERTNPSPLKDLPTSVESLGTEVTNVRVLYKGPEQTDASEFYLVAADPPVAPTMMAQEREELLATGALDNLAESCAGNMPGAVRKPSPDGGFELVTSITPFNTTTGCFVVLTVNKDAFLGTSIGQPYWQTWEVRTAVVIYVAMAVFTLGVFLLIWRNLMRFRRLAREIRTGRRDAGSFAAANRVSELEPVAEEFDRLTRSLQASADDIRRAAEDNAHAFKTPIAIMRQSLEPLQRLVPESSTRGQRALQVLETSIDRLDHLVNSARRLEETTAELLDPPNQAIDLSNLVRRMLGAYAEAYERRGLKFAARLQPGVVVRAGEDLLETVVENVVDNAVEVSPEGELIDVSLESRDGMARLVVRDRGPGVPDGQLDHIFERYVSLRGELPGSQPPAAPPPAPTAVTPTAVAPTAMADGEAGEKSGAHQGIGLWIVRRNLEAVGGSVKARNLPDGGLEITMVLPVAS